MKSKGDDRGELNAKFNGGVIKIEQQVAAAAEAARLKALEALADAACIKTDEDALIAAAGTVRVKADLQQAAADTHAARFKSETEGSAEEKRLKAEQQCKNGASQTSCKCCERCSG